MTHTLKTRLLFMFILFSFLSVIIVISLNTVYFRNREKVSFEISEITDLQMKFLQDFKSVDLFFSNDAISNQFYITKSSPNLNNHKANCILLESEIGRLSNKREINSEKLASDYQALIAGIAEYDLILSQLLELILERGFKDDGIVGEMRNYAHLLEKFPEVDQTLILSLRRHEKDYIIRNEILYITELRKLVKTIEEEVSVNPDITAYKKKAILSLLENYVYFFNKMVILDEKIGIRTSSGLKEQLSQKEQNILATLNEILIAANNSAVVI